MERTRRRADGARRSARGDRTAAAPAGPASFEIEIASLAAGGDGVGVAPDGRTIFVPGTAPGDRVRVRTVEERARFLRGRVEVLVEPGAARVDPVCPVFGSCGGCSWQHVDYRAQVQAKGAMLRAALERLAKLEVPGEIVVEPSPSPYAYRGRARVSVAAGRVGFRRRRSHAVCPTDRCPILLPGLEDALHRLAQAPPADGEWELVAGAGGAVRIAPIGARASSHESLIVAAGNDRLQVSAGVFVQSNALMLEAVADAVEEAAGRGELAVELYAGMGYLTLGLARRFRKLVAVESQRSAAGDLEANCHGAGLENVRIVVERAERVLVTPDLLPADPDVVVLDPPRTGLPPGCAESLVRLEARRIVVLSCDPATLSRDLAEFERHGYALRSVRGFDLFPQTPHVEALAVMELG